MFVFFFRFTARAFLCYNLPMKLIIASNNAHKMREISEILGAEFPDMVTLKQAGLEIDVVEDGDTFAANAIKKAEEVRLASGFPAALADDSGLIVDALGGAPGVFSARYAGEGHDDAANNAKLMRDMAVLRSVVLGLQGACHAALERVGDPRSQFGCRDDRVHRTHPLSPLDVVHGFELRRHLAELVGPHGRPGGGQLHP